MPHNTVWKIGKRFESSFHDLELGPDGLVYAVNISKHWVVTLDPKTSARHEEFGEQEATIKVGSSGSTEVGFSFKEKVK